MRHEPGDFQSRDERRCRSRRPRREPPGVSWAAMSIDDRAACLTRFADELRQNRDELREIICEETGKPRWESATEVDAMIGKIAISIESRRHRRPESVIKIADGAGGDAIQAARRRRGPRAVQFSRASAERAYRAGAARGKYGALQAKRTDAANGSESGRAVASRRRGRGCRSSRPRRQGDRRSAHQTSRTSTGFSSPGALPPAGRSIARCRIIRAKSLALEMGGNNPLVVHEPRDLTAAAYLTIQSAYLSAGQRCSCARRLIVTGDAEPFIKTLVAMIARIRVGRYSDSPEPFMGPVINAAAAQRLLVAQQDLIARGGIAQA